MNIKKFTTYEFDLKVGEKVYNVAYKKDESESGEGSFVEATFGSEKQRLDVNFLMSLYEAMKTVDPFGFVFEDALGGGIILTGRPAWAYGDVKKSLEVSQNQSDGKIGPHTTITDKRDGSKYKGQKRYLNNNMGYYKAQW
jgi:hypothetical protein